MSNQFKPGDLALIIGSKVPDSPNVGRSVELVRLIRTGERLDKGDGTFARHVGGEAWIVSAKGLKLRSLSRGWIDASDQAVCSEKYLIPLRGDFEPEQQKAKEAESCV